MHVFDMAGDLAAEMMACVIDQVARDHGADPRGVIDVEARSMTE